MGFFGAAGFGGILAPMQFADLTIACGRIYSRRRQDTSALEPVAVEVCRILLRRLRAGEIDAAHGVAGLPPFAVSLGLPEAARGLIGRDQEHVGRMFCVSEPGAKLPFLICVILGPGDNDPDHAGFVVGSLMGLSAVTGKLDAGSEAAPIEILASAPVLATAVWPARPEAIRIGADFATCFAAAMLLEDAEE